MDDFLKQISYLVTQEGSANLETLARQIREQLYGGALDGTSCDLGILPFIRVAREIRILVL